jgi:23S rRNA (uracil1939-C5)-methyltransferase
VSIRKYKMSRSRPEATPFGGVTSVEIDAWAAGGRGIGRVGGQVWMVAGAIPGDLVAAKPLADHGRFVEAVVASLERPSPSRRQAPCGYQSTCGGCPLMVVDESLQLVAKKQVVLDAPASNRAPAGKRPG